MDEFDFFMDEDEYAIEEEYEFESFIDHDSGYEQDEQSYYAEAMLAYYDQAKTAVRVTYLTLSGFDFLYEYWYN